MFTLYGLSREERSALGDNGALDGPRSCSNTSRRCSDAVARLSGEIASQPAKKQVEAGKADQGERAGVTAGENMDGFVSLVLFDIVRSNGLAQAQLSSTKDCASRCQALFRPTKLWDILVTVQGTNLIAAIELKSHVGPSFGNNFNNVERPRPPG